MKHDLVKISTAIALICITIMQIIWAANMYNSNTDNLIASVEKSLDYAALSEYGYRNEKLGGPLSFSPFLSGADEGVRYVTKTIQAGDTSYVVRIDRYDGRSLEKLVQFLLKHTYPINLNQLDSLFRQSLAKDIPTIERTYIDYLDLESGKIIKSTNSEGTGSTYISSAIYPLDINNSIAVQAHVENPVGIILSKMILQLIISGVLIAISFYSLFCLLKAFLLQKKEERMRQDAISAMTHEFKRPISGAVAQVALIPYYLEKGDTNKVIQYADNALLELNKLTAYTEKIQRISKENNVKLDLEKSSTYLPDFFNRIYKKYTQIAENKVDLSLNLNTDIEYANLNFLHMSNVMDNLIENAIKYSKDCLKIYVNVEDVKEELTIRVQDNGVGISKLDINNIFDKYYRSSDISKSSKAGFGLGLTYCKLVVEEHGGTIGVKSELGVGSEFLITIPIKTVLL